MPFALDDTSISLMTIGETIAQSDLVPSRLPLRDHVLPLMRQFNAWGLEHLGDLRKALKTPKKALVLAQTLQIDPQLLVLLRREIEAFFPKPIPLREWVWFHEKDLAFLSDKGISNHIDLYNSLTEPGLRRELEGELEPSASWNPDPSDPGADPGEVGITSLRRNAAPSRLPKSQSYSGGE
jgi:hypothetical protein